MGERLGRSIGELSREGRKRPGELRGQVGNRAQALGRGLDGGPSVVQRRARALGLLGGSCCPRLQGGDGFPKRQKLRLGVGYAGERPLFRSAHLTFRLRGGVVDRGCHHAAYRGHERGVDGLVQGVDAGVRDLGRHGAGLLVDVVLQLRLHEVAGGQGEQVGGEGLRDDDGGIGLPAAHLGQRRLLVGEVPIQLIVALQLVHDLRSQVKRSCELGGASFVLVHDADAHAAGVVVGIPEAQHVVPGVQRGKHQQREADNEGLRGLEEPQAVAFQHAQDVAHGCVGAFLGSGNRV